MSFLLNFAALYNHINNDNEIYDKAHVLAAFAYGMLNLSFLLYKMTVIYVPTLLRKFK